MSGGALGVGMKIDRRDRKDKVFHLLRMKRRVTGGENTALANPQQGNPVVPGFLAYPIDGGVDVVVDIVVDREPALGSAGLAPVDQP